MKSLLPLKSVTAVFTAAIISATPVASAESKIASGIWTKKEHAVGGSWQIVEDGGVRRLKLIGFKTKSAPDLKVFFSAKPLSQINGKNASAGNYRLVKLKSSKGVRIT